MSLRSRVAMGGYDAQSRNSLPQKLVILLCIGSFFTGMFFTNRMWMVPERTDVASKVGSRGGRIMMDNDQKEVTQHESNHIPGVFSAEEYAMKTLKKTISKLEVELATARAAQETILNGSPISGSIRMAEITTKRKYLVVIGINTAFNSRKRRDSVRATWMPQGDERKKLEEEKGIVIRFVIGHSMNGVPHVDLSRMSLVSIVQTLPADSTAGGILDRAIEAEEKKHGDFLRLEHVEGYTELSAKTKQYFATAVGLWDADFYVKVDDDVHVNIATLGMTLARYRLKPRVYIGCMKSGPILAQKGVRYHEPEHWKLGGEGNKYFRHATGQLYAISRDLAVYIAINQYANEDVSLGSWLIGLDVSHIDDKRLCCGTPPDCEWKAQAGNICAASFDWNCSGICQSDERIFEVHQRCSEEENAIWNASF